MFEQWKRQADSVCCGIIYADPYEPESAYDDVPLAALVGLSALPGCPDEYKVQAGKIDLDNQWGPVARETHLLLAKLASPDGEQGAPYIHVREYYERYGV